MSDDLPNSILLVDDDPSVRIFLSRRLEAAGFKARQAEDGIDGLVKLRDELPDVIISALEMPRMSGMEFVSVVRHRFPSLPVIALSGTIPNEFPKEAKPDVWFEKGALNFSELLRTLHDLVRKTRGPIDIPQVVNSPVRIRPGVAGYLALTCPDCLRTFRTMCLPEEKTAEWTAVCSHCEARVPFLVEGIAPE
jgi:CheY-like chemotaxis protein